MSENITPVANNTTEATPHPVFDSPVFNLLRDIQEELRLVSYRQEDLDDAMIRLSKQKDKSREVIAEKLDALSELISIPEHIDLFGSTLHVSAEWYEHADIFDAVKVIKEPRYKTILELAEESIASQKEAA